MGGGADHHENVNFILRDLSSPPTPLTDNCTMPLVRPKPVRVHAMSVTKQPSSVTLDSRLPEMQSPHDEEDLFCWTICREDGARHPKPEDEYENDSAFPEEIFSTTTLVPPTTPTLVKPVALRVFDFACSCTSC